MTLKEAFDYVEARDFPCVSFLMNMRRGWTAQRRSWMPRGRDRTLLCLSARRAVFDEREIELALFKGVRPISLGRRILRDGDSGLALLSVLMMRLEGAL